MFFKTVLLNIGLLCGTFGVAVVVGYGLSKSSTSKASILTRQAKPHSPSVQKQDGQSSSNLKKGQAQSQSASIGFSHQGLKTDCQVCHKMTPDQPARMSPHFLGHFAKLEGKTGGEVDRAFLGILATDVQPSLRSHLKLKSNQGAIVENVIDESPAYHCGIEKHDIVVAVDQMPVAGKKGLLEFVRSKAPGTKVEVQYIRQGQKGSCSVVLGKQRTARILNSFRIQGCQAPLAASTNCQNCHETGTR